MLTVQIDKLCQCQPVNRLGKVIGGIVVPDVAVIRAGGQDRFRFAECDDAHFFGLIAAQVALNEAVFFTHAASFLTPQRDFGLFS